MRFLGFAAMVAACVMTAVFAISNDEVPVTQNTQQDEVAEKKGCVKQVDGGEICDQNQLDTDEQ